ncbi:trypsin-like serine peptidase [Micromonospora fluostatini]|uniref:trypsin-like serine peptidase n=1 Tax=Micromonospora sp. JCM 30529 TaxID=3421643 RepID=UPI003D17290A
MSRQRWAVVALAALALGTAAPPAGPAVAAPSRDRAVTTSADNRVPVADTTTYPASATVLLTFPGGRCTGFMISARTVVTAGHCVHSGGSSGTWRTNVVAYPGHTGTTAPFGACAAARLFAPQGWTGASNAPGGGDPTQNYGAVQLTCGVGTTTGWFNPGYTTRPVTGSCTTTHGYPADRPGQWTSNAVIRAETAGLLYAPHAFSGGQDGSPVFYTPDPDDWCPTPPQLVIPCPCPPPPFTAQTALGILVSGPGGTGPGLTNSIATRFTAQAVSNLMQWR